MQRPWCGPAFGWVCGHGRQFVRSLSESLLGECVSRPCHEAGSAVWRLALASRVRPGGRGQCGQATKGVWGMSWRQEAMKGVEDCDKPGGAVKRALRPGYPNERALNP